jgi:ring-1,2-phenylacetyl-CoA epoxidase subunit PaaA
VVMNVLMGLAVSVQLKEFSRISYAPLAEVFDAIAPREQRHAELGVEGLSRIVASEEGRLDARKAVAFWHPRVAASFGQAGSARFETLKRFGLRHQSNEALLQDWTNAASRQLAALNLN